MIFGDNPFRDGPEYELEATWEHSLEHSLKQHLEKKFRADDLTYLMEEENIFPFIKKLAQDYVAQDEDDNHILSGLLSNLKHNPANQSYTWNGTDTEWIQKPNSEI